MPRPRGIGRCLIIFLPGSVARREMFGPVREPPVGRVVAGSVVAPDYVSTLMATAASFSGTESAAQLAAEQARRAQAEAALAVALARIAELEQQVAGAGPAEAATVPRGQQPLYESLLEHVATAVALFDNEHRYLFVNAAIEPDPEQRAWMLGKTSTEACARRKRPAEIGAQRAAAFAEALRTNQEVSLEESHPTPDGARALKLLYRPVTGPDGTRYVVATSLDITEHRRAEQLLARQREFYEAILDLLPFDVAVFDAGHRYLYANPATIADPAVRQQSIGMTSADYLAWRQPERWTELAEQREQYFDLAVRTHADVTWEEMRTGRNQRPQLMVRHLRPVFTPEGALRLVVGSGIDITARYTAEQLQQHVQEMLLEQQAFIRLIVDTLPNGLYLVEPNGSISFSNAAFAAQMARSQHLQPGPRPPQVQQELDAMQELNAHVLRTGQAITREMPRTLPDGRVEYFSVHKKPLLRAGGAMGILTISTDITAVKQARQALERREKQYSDLVRYSQALICTHDLAGTVLSVNPAIERLLGRPAAELLGHSLTEVLPPLHHAALGSYLAGFLPLQTQERVLMVQTFGGEWRYLHCFAYRVEEENLPPYVVASAYDVTATVLAQRGLLRAKREAEANALAKEAFLARMSHEIRTPLHGVLGMAALLRQTPLSPEQAQYLQAMQQAGQHLLSLLNEVLDLAKITARHLHLHLAPFDVAELLAEAGQAVAALAETQGLALRVEPLALADAQVVGDAYRLRQVLLNLLSNALKFTEQGEVRLGAAVLRDTPAALTLRFWVQDTGIGIAPAEQARIFEACAQAPPETSVRYGGTGLGLSISQQLVAQMGGQLGLRSAPGQGSTFAFELNLPRTAALAHPPPASPPPDSFEGLRGLRVLLAEDNLINQWIARVILEHWGVEVLAVGNGLEALAHLRQRTFDAAMLDIRMPGLSGMEITTALRADPDPARAQLPVVAVTANAFENDRAAYLAAGMNACLIKPYEAADLCQLLLQLTGRE